MTYEGGDSNAEQAKGHAGRRGRQIAKLDQSGHLWVYLQAETAVAESSQESALRGHRLERGRPVVELLLADVESLDLQLRQRRVLNGADHLKIIILFQNS